ncbi:MAG: chromosome segregation protein SMC [Anaerolineales bacterium]
MPLRLKSLELHGYKTFAGKTAFEFAGGVTAIVGPNGSGKSNIADALRWVLGEQSYSLLRAKKTEDMIFSGSDQRPRAGMASATIVFDNADGWLPVDFSEVALTRRAYRDGRNEYLLNGQQVRLRDINELLAQSGLSERTYTILGQGLVDASLALKADERRRLFEEAAGIGLYRARREETLRRLETTRRNLDRVLDILAELEPRLRSLERQAKRAQEYAQIQADLRLLLLDWYGFHWHRAQRELVEARTMAVEYEAKLQEARQAHQAVRQETAAFRDRLQGLRARLNSWHRQSAQLHTQRETISRDLAVLDERRRALLENRARSRSEQARLEEELRLSAERLAEAAAEVERLQAEAEEAGAQMAAAQQALEARQAEMAAQEAELEAARRRLNELEARQAQLQARLDELMRRAAEQAERLAAAETALAQAEAQVGAAETALAAAQDAAAGCQAELQRRLADLQTAEQQAAEQEQALRRQQEERAARSAEHSRLQAQLQVLEQAEQSLTGYADGARLLLEAARQSRLSGARGALFAALEVPAGLEEAVAAALGEYLDAVLLQSGTQTEQALALFDSDAPGRAAILPLEWLSPAEPLSAPADPDCLGLAADLVQAPAELRPALDLLLGQVLIVRDRRAARRLLAGLPAEARAVTLRGEVFSAGGPVLAGKPARAAILARPRQRRQAQQALASLEGETAALDQRLQKTGEALEVARQQAARRAEAVQAARHSLEQAQGEEQQARLRLEAARRERQWQATQGLQLRAEIEAAQAERAGVEAALSAAAAEVEATRRLIQSGSLALAALTLEEVQAQAAHWRTRLAVAERALEDARARQAERSQTADRLREEVAAQAGRGAEMDAALADLESQRQTLHAQETGLHSQLEALRALIEPAERDLETAEAQEIELQNREAESQQNLARLERQYTQIQLDLSRRQEALENLRQRIEDDFGLVAFEYSTSVDGPVPLPFEGMVSQLPVLAELPPDVEEQLSRQRALLRRMGAVNLDAQAEYLSVRERFDFLNQQLEDLRKAEADLHQVIAELDDLTRREFQKTFEAVAAEFHTIFHRLFGGGSARLVLTEPENLTETGIDIEARLPGRREQGLSLLSGGERSLTAIALVFALLKVSPTPVCVMDEVDAMLDEANVGRFRDLLLELSRQTQFVIITHNRNTVQAADVIYGVTMGRDSTSQVISLRLDEVSEEYYR